MEGGDGGFPKTARAVSNSRSTISNGGTSTSASIVAIIVRTSGAGCEGPVVPIVMRLVSIDLGGFIVPRLFDVLRRQRFAISTIV